MSEPKPFEWIKGYGHNVPPTWCHKCQMNTASIKIGRLTRCAICNSNKGIADTVIDD